MILFGKVWLGMALVAVLSTAAGAQEPAATALAIQDAMNSGDMDGAARLLGEALKRQPRDGGLLNLRGILRARRNELSAARDDFRMAAKNAPGLVPAWQNLARACQHLDDTACALPAWQHVANVRPGDGEAHAQLALLYQQQGQFLESLKELDTSQQENAVLRAIDLSALGRVQEAKQQAQKAAAQGDFSEAGLGGIQGALHDVKNAAVAAELLEGLDQRGRASVTSLRQLVVAYEALGRAADASQLLERIARLDPNRAADLLELARLAEADKKYEAALGYLAHARDLEPKNARIHFLFGLVAGELDLPIEAKRSLEEALALDLGNPNYHYALGTVILKTRDAAAAASHFSVFVAAHPDDARGHYALGLAHFAAADYGGAKAEMRLAGKDARLVGASEYYLGRIARLEGDESEAEARLRRAVELLPEFSEAHTELARLALRRGNEEAARSELERALQLTPESFQANEQLLILYKRTRDARAGQQAELLKKLDEERSRRAELMVRTIEIRP